MLFKDQIAEIEKRTKKAPVEIVALANVLGLEVYSSSSLEDSISGLIKKDEEKGGSSGYAIFVNAKHSKERRRFTIAHEIAHFVLHKNLIGNSVVESPLFRRKDFTNSVELQANAMAADILMPRKLIEEYQKNGVTQISKLAEIFNVSKSAMSVRVLGVPYEQTG